MRVALLSYNAQPHNAIGNQIAEKVRFLQERGAEVRVFVQDGRLLHTDLQAVTSEVREVASEGSVWAFLRQADLVIAVYAQACELWQYLPMLEGVGPRVLFDYHGVTPPELWGDQTCEGLRASQRERGYVWFADHVITTSHFTRQELQGAAKYPAEKITVLPLPVDTARFHPKTGERYLHVRLGIDGRILLFVGRLAANKRVSILIEALAKLADRTLHAVIVGDQGDIYAAELVRCREHARNLGVAERVHFLPQMDDADLARAYQSSNALVMPSLHEGFCLPVVEAMASGLPVIAARSTALPETVADAGLTFVPDDVDDLVRQLRRGEDVNGISSPLPLYAGGEGPGVRGAAPCGKQRAHATDTVPPHPSPLPPITGGEGEFRALRIAVVSFRCGSGIVGGAETSLGVMARALRDAGHHVRVLTTCTASESAWTNELPAGAVIQDGLHVERFPIDPHDPAAHGQTVRAILETNGNVAPELERQYLKQSIHSSALIDALRARHSEFDAIVVGPYLFGLTADVVTEFSRKTLLVPCFHDEALARLTIWPRLYSTVGGVLFHSREEQDYAQRVLGVNHPNARVMGTYLALAANPPRPEMRRPAVVYCGRYSTQKNVPLLLEWATRYQIERPGRIEFIFMGQGDVKLPRVPWLRDLGRVEAEVKQAVLADALALVQLSTNESLSLVALEAWACETPVIAHRGCAVLRGQIERSQGGAAVADYASFAAALDDLQSDANGRHDRGKRGRAYVVANYGNAKAYVQTLIDSIETMQRPLAEQMRASGLRRAQEFARARWQERFADLLERVLSEPARRLYEQIEIQPLRAACASAVGMRTLLLPVRLRNDGTQAAASDGPGRTMIACDIVDIVSMQSVGDCQWSALASLLAPGQSQTTALPITLPAAAGQYRIRLWCARPTSTTQYSSAIADIPLTISARSDLRPATCASTFLETVQETLPTTQQLQQLPGDYVDVTEGRFAPAKRWIKRKLLNNFKQAYVDRLSRQQSQVNGQVVVMIQQLTECCTMLDHAVQGLHRRLDGLETKIEQIASDHTAHEEIHG